MDTGRLCTMMVFMRIQAHYNMIHDKRKEALL